MEDDEEVKVTADSYGVLDTTEASKDCWLIRIPAKLYDLWEKAPEGTNLGELVFTKGGKVNNKPVKPSLDVKVSPDILEPNQALPLNYSMQAMTKKVPVMHPFVRNSKDGTCAILGTVSRTANLQMNQDNSYRKLLKSRLVESNITSSRFVKPVEASQSILSKQRANSSKRKRSFGNAVFEFGKRKLEAANADKSVAAVKKTRLFTPDQPLRSVIFELFSQEEFWAMKDLRAAAVSGGSELAAAKAGEKDMREILKSEIGYFHRSGEHKGKWELRQEFKQKEK